MMHSREFNKFVKNDSYKKVMEKPQIYLDDGSIYQVSDECINMSNNIQKIDLRKRYEFNRKQISIVDNMCKELNGKSINEFKSSDYFIEYSKISTEELFSHMHIAETLGLSLLVDIHAELIAANIRNSIHK
jgi:hypothetical protein